MEEGSAGLARAAPQGIKALILCFLQVKEDCIASLSEEKLSAAAAIDMLQLKLIAASQEVSVLKGRAVAHDAEVSRMRRRLKFVDLDRQQLQKHVQAVEANLHSAQTQIKVTPLAATALASNRRRRRRHCCCSNANKGTGIPTGGRATAEGERS